VEINIELSKNFETDENLGGLIESKSSKFEISNIHESSTDVKNETHNHKFIGHIPV
jgi:hypothetical protein